MKRTKGYLLDTSVISAWFIPAKNAHENVLKHIERAAVKKSQLFVSAITFGEIEYGHWAESPVGPTRVQAEYKAFVLKHFVGIYRIAVSHHTAEPYGRIRATIFKRYSPKQGRKKRRLHQLDWPDDIEAYGHKIQENDLWIASQAVHHNLVLVAADHMKVIVECAKLCGFDLDKENWCEPP